MPRQFVIHLLFGLFLTTFGPVFAEDPPKSAQKPTSPPAPPATPMSPVDKGLAFLEGIPLTEEQKEKIKQIHAESTKQISQYQATLQDSSKSDDKEKLKDRNVLQQIRQVQQETFLKIHSLLTTDQKRQIVQQIRNYNTIAPSPDPTPFELFSDPLFVENLLNDPANKETNMFTLWRGPFELPEEQAKTIPSNPVDQPILDLLAKRGIQPAEICSDAVFIRRLYLDVIGTIPTAKETTDFLHDERPNKRSLLIDSLLERPEFADYWTLKWGDILRVKAEFPINLWPNGAMVYSRWIRESLRTNKPYDQFVRELLLGSGSNFRSPPANFYRALQNRDPYSIAGTVALTFMGTRTGPWPREKQDQMSLFFSRVAYKKSAEWKEEIVYWNDEPLEQQDVVFPDGKKGRILPDQDPREVFADWLITPENPWFAKNVVNRIWFWLFGIGIVEEPDDIRDDNLPSNPELLNRLADELVKAKYDLRQIYRLILNSRTYQLSSIPKSTAPEAGTLFAYYPTRQIAAEVLQDMLRHVLGVNLGYSSEVPEPFTNIPDYFRTITLADGSITNPFLETFGRPARDTGLESERNSVPNVSQRMFLINSADMMDWIERSNKLRSAANAAANAGKKDERRKLMLNYLWLSILNRYPISQETMIAESLFSKKGANETTIYQDLVWTLLNSKEFLCKH